MENFTFFGVRNSTFISILHQEDEEGITLYSFGRLNSLEANDRTMVRRKNILKICTSSLLLSTKRL